MTTEKLKVYNPQKFDIGVITLDKPNGLNIKAGSFALQTQEDIDYVASISTVFQRGLLRIEAPAEKEIMKSLGVDVDTDINFIDDDEIRQKLSMAAKALEKWLSDITEKSLLERIYEIAIDMNLNMSKIKVLQAKMPDKNFLDEK